MNKPSRETAQCALRALIALGYNKTPGTDYIINDQLKKYGLDPLPPEKSPAGDWQAAAAAIWNNLDSTAKLSREEARPVMGDPFYEAQQSTEADVCGQALWAMKEAGYENGDACDRHPETKEGGEL